ncbi:PREDICTED: uncharacterized protein LOC108556841 [Nicrophorus vespilloides]|uniref:Uncharacterized protein LOC108556841 n=1 Tax=Nicrophorus vespilloides TaxID=110193 RepID=A0ABM1M213_NICVS|nr:PREDICTED: uncharacterized protein LOC108556841 [Nicrophorus vespilloides]
MSVSDPLIKELKVFTGKLLGFEEINDDCDALIGFCQCVERIFAKGILQKPNSFGIIRRIDAWTWMERISNELNDFGYKSSVESARNRKDIFTNRGRFRALVRYCLNRRCLHVPVEQLIHTETFNKYYDNVSVIGDVILNEILLSVLYQCGKINFRLRAELCSFLDLSWLIPEVKRFDLVPTQNLGLSISFAGEKAVIVNVKSNSVCGESRKIAVGDVLDSMNGMCICFATKGRLSTMLKCQKHVPITLIVVKGFSSSDGKIYPPMVNLYKEIDLDLDMIKARNNVDSEDENRIATTFKSKNGFICKYLGNVDVGRYGDVKIIDKAFTIYLTSSNSSYHRFNKCKSDVLFEVCDLGVKCFHLNTTETILEHSFMEISACGSTTSLPTHFAYIAGEEYCDVATNFKCYIFSASNEKDCTTILQGIGQGFERTHYAV